jgi:hypothetical protein
MLAYLFGNEVKSNNWQRTDQWSSCCSIFSFLCSVLQIVVCHFNLFCFGHCVVCPSSIYEFWLSLWYLQTLHNFIATESEQKIKRRNAHRIRVRVMVFNATFNNISVISWRPALLVEETTDRWQTLSHNVVSSTPRLGGKCLYNEDSTF